MSEPIPEDIDLIATDLVRKSYADAECAEWEMYLDTARAILAERERCADIAFAATVDHGAPFARELHRRILSTEEQKK